MSSNWNIADYLQLSYLCLTAISIIVTAYMAFWVVQSLQKKIDNEKFLREHFAHEIIALRKDIRQFFTNIFSGKMKSPEIKRTHYILSSQIKDLLNVLNKKYNIDKHYLKAYKTNLSKIIEEDSNYTDAYNTDEKVSLTEETLQTLHNLERNNDHLFNEILLKIYD